MTPVSRTVSLCVVFIVAVLSMLVYTTLQTPQLSEEELRAKGVFLLPRPRDITPFELADHNGAVFDNAALKERWTFIFFGFTHCPDVCPTTMSEMGQADAVLRRDGGTLADQFQGVLVTVDPERDTAEILGQYATAFSPRFRGVLGDRESVAQFAQQVNAAFAKVPQDGGGYTMDHTGNIIIINPHGHYHGFIKLPHQAETIRLAYQSLAASL
jgi:protein SCO1/2